MHDPTTERAARGTSYTAVTIAFLAGGLAGAAAAMLLAPQSGAVTRAIMGRKLNEASGSARDLRDRAIRRGREIRDEAAHRVEGAASALAGKAGQKESGNGDLEGAAPSA